LKPGLHVRSESRKPGRKVEKTGEGFVRRGKEWTQIQDTPVGNTYSESKFFAILHTLLDFMLIFSLSSSRIRLVKLFQI
jgi:hypothetical protein